MPYITADELRQEIQSNALPNVTHSGLYEAVVEAASAAVDDHCYRTFVEAGEDATPRTFKASRCGTWVEDLDDIASVDDLAVAVDSSLNGTYTAAAVTDWFADVDGRSGRVVGILSTAAFPYSPVRRTVQVTARWGWPATPAPVKRATMIFAIRLVNRRSTPTGVVAFGEFGGVRLSRLDPDVVALLAPYRRRDRLVR